MVDTQITKTKKLTHEFKRLRLGTPDLERIGLKFQEYGNKIDSKIDIEVSSIDGEDIITFNNPAVFSDNSSLPRQIGSINFSLGNYSDGTRINLDIGKPHEKYATLEMTSNNGIHASGIFADLVKEIENYEITGKGIIKFAGSPAGHVLLAILSTALMYLALLEVKKLIIFLFGTETADAWNPGINFLFILLLVATLVISSMLANYLLRKKVHPVMFEGDLVNKPPFKASELFRYILMLFRSS